MTGVQYTALAYVFASTVLLGYAATLYWGVRATRGTRKEDAP
jgi:hypothetical protein